MSDRFAQLPESCKDSLRALQLLAAGGVEPFTHERIEHVLKHVFQRTLEGSRLRDDLGRLTRYSFLLHPEGTDPVRIEAAHVVGQGAPDGYYLPCRTSRGDLDRLERCLLAARDTAGLNCLAVTRYYENDLEAAVAVWDGIIRVFENSPEAALREVVAAARQLVLKKAT